MTLTLHRGPGQSLADLMVAVAPYVDGEPRTQHGGIQLTNAQALAYLTGTTAAPEPEPELAPVPPALARIADQAEQVGGLRRPKETRPPKTTTTAGRPRSRSTAGATGKG